MKIKFLLTIILLCSVAFTASSHAQEAQVPLDKEGKLEYIDSELGQKLNLFPDYKNFLEARLFQTSDTTFVLEISYQPEKTLLKARLPLTAGETREFRRKVTERIKQEKPQVYLNQEGRTKLLTGSLALSMGYYGWAVPVIFEVEDGKSAVATYMLISGAGFFIPLVATKGMRVTDADATLCLYGGTRGIVHGMFTYGLLLGKEAEGRGAIASGMVGSLVEGLVFFHLADKSNMTPGTAEVICIGGDFGLGLGFGTAHLADLYDEDNERSFCTNILLGSGAGLLYGKLLSDHQPYTRGDAFVLRGAGFLGAYLPVAAVDLAHPEDEKAYTASAMIGVVAGLSVGDFLVKGKDFTTGQGTLINLGELAGGLVGLGVAYLVSSEDDNSALYLTSSAVGATAGFWLLYRSFSRSAQTDRKASSLDVQFAPEGVLAYVMSKKSKWSSKQISPLGKLEYRF
jgi:hypothetical protein